MLPVSPCPHCACPPSAVTRIGADLSVTAGPHTVWLDYYRCHCDVCDTVYRATWSGRSRRLGPDTRL